MAALGAAYAASLPALDTTSMVLGLSQMMPTIPKVLQVPLGNRDGAYDPEHHLILLDSDASPQRQRFTLAHEISHALLLNDDDLLSDVHDLYSGSRLEQAIETLCNVGAAALLMPPPLVTELLERWGPSARALSELAWRANVSASAAMYTLAERTAQPVVYALCGPAERGGKETKDREVGLEVRASAPSATFPYKFSAGSPIPPEHPVGQALLGLPVECWDMLPFRSGRRMPAYVTAYPLGGQLAAAAFALPQRRVSSGE